MRAGRIRPAKPGGMGRDVTVREQVALAGYTTLGLGGPAARFIEAGTDQQVIAAVEAADRRREPVLVLGGGSNLVVADAGFPGTVVKVATRGITARARWRRQRRHRRGGRGLGRGGQLVRQWRTVRD